MEVGMLTATGTGYAQETVTRQSKGGNAYTKFTVAFMGSSQEFFVDEQMASRTRLLEGKTVTVRCQVEAKGFDVKLKLVEVQEAQAAPRVRSAA